ncbi:lactonase family protein [Streptomyces olivaceus]
MTPDTHHPNGRLIAYIGSYGSDTDSDAGGITALDVSHDGHELTTLSKVTEPLQAGYLAYTPATRTLYAVDERKTDGRGPVQPPASVHALSVSRRDGSLTWLNSHIAPGPNPTFLSIDENRRLLLCANHGGFEHVEHIVRTDDGWDVLYLYDHSAVLLYELDPDGKVGRLRDVQVLDGHGHGPDPNSSPQAGGHGQASAHAHSIVIDPSGQYALVGDKGTDRIYVYKIDGKKLELAHTVPMPPETGPRHFAFDASGHRVYMTCEFASDVASFDFDPHTGKLRLIDQISTLAAGYDGPNEPAEIRLHPNGKFLYANNRGEDTLAWFRIARDGRLTRAGDVKLAASLNPGVAARSFTFAPSGDFLLVADRPADLVRSYAVDARDGTLAPLAEERVAQAGFVTFAQLSGR